MKTVPLGRIAKPHGIRGELRVELHWAESDALMQAESILIEREGELAERRRIEQARRADKAILVKLEGVNDRTQAELLRGAAVLLERSELPALEAGEYYLIDLVGARVVGPQGEVGQVVRVNTHPSINSVTIRLPDGQLAEQVLADAWVTRIDPEAKLVELSSLDGLIV